MAEHLHILSHPRRETDNVTGFQVHDVHLEELWHVVEHGKDERRDQEVLLLHGHLGQGVADGAVPLQGDGQSEVGGANAPDVKQPKGVGRGWVRHPLGEPVPEAIDIGHVGYSQIDCRYGDLETIRRRFIAYEQTRLVQAGHFCHSPLHFAELCRFHDC